MPVWVMDLQTDDCPQLSAEISCLFPFLVLNILCVCVCGYGVLVTQCYLFKRDYANVSQEFQQKWYLFVSVSFPFFQVIYSLPMLRDSCDAGLWLILLWNSPNDT
ncbi:uncharacterized protein TM35_000102850 [Trypanosoma theileri]|uniref:Uncharacterized protein n=1 Tax=Trypanosoma theileri TaxID=67003 RepID=A0A1X0NZA1_9TRYP|nr:uncharacterized protein TM35_000102850 [Trypanosoma theileri]ORC90017.1 hypothetical protein TM35_000102850 [Trypanosoma theileri]